MTRQFWVWLHRWVGLSVSMFLIVTALTGSVLAFKTDINEALGARPSRRIAAQDRPLLDALALRQRAVLLEPLGEFDQLPLRVEATRLFEIPVHGRVDPSTGQRPDLGYAALHLDPYSGELIRRIARDSFGQGPLWPISRENLMNVVFALHTRLAIPGNVGVWALGAVAVAWTVDCFVGLYLSLPPRQRCRDTSKGARASGRGFWRRWMSAWAFSWRGKAVRIHHKMHVAASLWTWVMLLVFAWSSVYFELGPQVYQPVMGAFGMKPYLADFYAMPDLPAPRPPAMSWLKALDVGHGLAQELAPQSGFVPGKPLRLQYEESTGLFIYMISSSRSPDASVFGTLVVFDGDTGKLWGLFHLTGQDAGTTITAWLTLLHLAQVGGMPIRAFVCGMGLVVTVLSITGVYLWLKKRRGRQRAVRNRIRNSAIHSQSRLEHVDER